MERWKPWHSVLADATDSVLFVQGFIGEAERGILTVAADGLVTNYVLHPVSGHPSLDRMFHLTLGDLGPISSITSDCVDGPPSMLYSGHTKGHVSRWSVRGRLLTQLSGHQAAVTVTRYLGSGPDLATASMDGTIRAWHLAASECVLVLELGLRNPVADLVLLSPLELVVATWDGQLRFLSWQLEAAQACCNKALQATMVQVRAICAWRPDDSEFEVFAGTDEGEISCWSSGGVAQRLSWQGHWSQICSLSICKAWLISLAEDKLVRLWDAKTGKLLADYWGHGGGVLCSSVLWPMLWTGSRDHTVRSWDLEEVEVQLRELASMRICDAESLHYEVNFSRLTAKQLKKLAAAAKAAAKGKAEKRKGNARR